MKKKIYYLMILAVGAMLGSCDGNERLAGELQGTWTGTPEKFNETQALSATIIESYTFMRDSASNAKHPGGALNVTGLVSSMSQLPANGLELEMPITLSSSATVSVAGTWSVVDDDEVAVVMDAQSLQVRVDPDAVVVSENVLTDKGTPDLATLKKQFSENVAARLRQEMATRYGGLRHLDDVKVKDGTMLKFEIGKTDYVFTRQGAPK